MKLTEKYHQIEDGDKAYQFKDEEIVQEWCNCRGQDDKPYKKWPGKQKNVFYWLELANGYAVGWNENISHGLTFPVLKLKADQRTDLTECGHCHTKVPTDKILFCAKCQIPICPDHQEYSDEERAFICPRCHFSN